MVKVLEKEYSKFLSLQSSRLCGSISNATRKGQFKFNSNWKEPLSDVVHIADSIFQHL